MLKKFSFTVASLLALIPTVVTAGPRVPRYEKELRCLQALCAADQRCADRTRADETKAQDLPEFWWISSYGRNPGNRAVPFTRYPFTLIFAAGGVYGVDSAKLPRLDDSVMGVAQLRGIAGPTRPVYLGWTKSPLGDDVIAHPEPLNRPYYIPDRYQDFPDVIVEDLTAGPLSKRHSVIQLIGQNDGVVETQTLNDPAAYLDDRVGEMITSELNRSGYGVVNQVNRETVPKARYESWKKDFYEPELQALGVCAEMDQPRGRTAARQWQSALPAVLAGLRIFE